MLKINNLSLNYDDTEILKNISLSINKGEIVGIIGMSGAGKTSLIRCLCCLEKPKEGSIFINNLDISNRQASLNLASTLGVVFQGYNLLMQKSVYYNLALPMTIQKYSKKIIDERVKELLKLVDLEDKAFTYPAKLSGGQKQRVAIARALATNPKILLLDEITSALDPINTEIIINLLKKINQEYQVTILLITHEINVIKLLCERMCVMDEGKIIETGETKEVFTNPRQHVTKLLIGKSGDYNG